MSKLIYILIAVLLFLPVMAGAQEDVPPLWAVKLQESLDRIEAKLNAGVKLQPTQGAVQFSSVRIIGTRAQHDAVLYIRNYGEGAAVIARGGVTGAEIQADRRGAALWLTAPQGTGLIAEGNISGAKFEGYSNNGLTIMGGYDALSLLGGTHYGINNYGGAAGAEHAA